MVGFLSNAFTTGHQVKNELNGHITDIKHFSVHGMTGVYMTMFNTHSARTECYAYGLAPPVLAFSPEI
jgi:beta-glucosidase-like glycosyl hydrolase